MIRKLLQKHFSDLLYFYRYLRYRIFVAMGLNLAVGVLDGFGLAMFLPLLQMAGEGGKTDTEGLGNLAFIVEGIEALGIEMTLATALGVMLVFFMFKGLAKFGSEAYRVISQQFFVKKIRLDLLKKFNTLSYKYFVTADVGRIQNTMTGEVDRVSRAYLDYFRTFEQVVMVLVYMTFALFVDARFAGLVIIGGWLSNFLYSLIYKKTKGASRSLTKSSHILQGQVIQHVANFKYLKATGLVPFYAERLKKSILDIEQERKTIGILGSILGATREPILIAIVAGVILLQTQVLAAPLGPILISLLFFYRALTALVNLQNSWNRFLEVSGSMENMTQFQHELTESKETTGKQTLSAFQQALVLENVGFAYQESPVLEKISLRIAKNETVAFVGESGSGKTTLVNLLAGLISPDQGQFTIDGLSRDALDLQSYQQRIGYITQEPVIFNDTIFNNVTLWAAPTPENTRRFQEALEKAMIAGFVAGLPEGAATPLGNNGINLSGGQKQRIAIARELYKDIDILIMDEATSALDSETEKSIQESIDILKGKYTILVVAHRLSTIRNADRIVVMDKGTIASEGAYLALLEQYPGFRKMVELQGV
jgi:subfamily B ATP-binding cassette protein MsbA